MPALIVIGCIILFFVFLFTVHAFITCEMYANDPAGPKLTVRLLCFTFKILPKKEKTYKIRNYTLKKIRKRDEAAAKKAAKKALKKKKKAEEKALKKAEKKAELEKLTRAEKRERKAKKKASRPALTDLIQLVCRVLSLFCSRFFGKLRLKVAMLHIRVGAADAMQTAVLYGAANQSIQYLLTGLSKVVRMKDLQKADIGVEPDFLSDKLEFDFKLTLRLSLGNLLSAAIKAGWKFLVGYIRIKPDPDHPKGAPKPPKAPKPEKPDPVPVPDERA